MGCHFTAPSSRFHTQALAAEMEAEGGAPSTVPGHQAAMAVRSFPLPRRELHAFPSVREVGVETMALSKVRTPDFQMRSQNLSITTNLGDLFVLSS